jgi:chromosome segregation ATPase
VAENNTELLDKLKEIESTLQTSNSDTAELKTVVHELKNIVQSLDKEVAIQSEKQSHLFYRIEQLQSELNMLEDKGDKANDRHRQLIENALMAVLGGVITYVFSLLK